MFRSICTTFDLLVDLLRFGRIAFQSRASLVAENLFLRKQLAFYKERLVKPRRLSDAARLLLVFLSRWFDWRNALIVVKPETLIGWHRKAFHIFWRWKCYGLGGRPRIPKNLRALIAEMIRENPTWGEGRVASELALKLGIRVSPRTVRAYWPEDLGPYGHRSQRWMTFARNHARAIVACDFVVVVTARFRLLYVLVVMEVGSRKLLHLNVTDHPTAFWTLQQLRESIPSDHAYRWLIHDRSGIFSGELDRSIGALGIEVLKTPVRAPKANVSLLKTPSDLKTAPWNFILSPELFRFVASLCPRTRERLRSSEMIRKLAAECRELTISKLTQRVVRSDDASRQPWESQPRFQMTAAGLAD